MDAVLISRYPFLTRAAEYVADQRISMDDILTSRGFQPARDRGRGRVLQAISSEITDDNTISDMVELFSYPIARVLVSCINDGFLTRRYSLAEARFAYTKMKDEQDDILLDIGNDFEIRAKISDSGFTIHFTDYIKGAAGMRAMEWKLVNRRLQAGYVTITRKDYARLIMEAIRERIISTLPVAVPERFCELLARYLEEIRSNLEVSKKEFDEEGFGAAQPGNFPPCIKHLISNVHSGANLAHSARFAMTSFLLTIGFSVDQVVQVFNVSPDFNEEMTRYQVEHIAGATGTTYKPPSCQTMITYGNCYGKDDICRTVGHPLSYYRKRGKKKSPDHPVKQDHE